MPTRRGLRVSAWPVSGWLVAVIACFLLVAAAHSHYIGINILGSMSVGRLEPA
jgi:hypothetical protein